MRLLLGLTSTKKDRIPDFIASLARSKERSIALFPTWLSRAERATLYKELEGIKGLTIPHVHIRADCDSKELAYLSEHFGTEVFNIHPRNSTHPCTEYLDAFLERVYVENVDIPVSEEEFDSSSGKPPKGLCLDFAHLENARLQERQSYVETMMRLVQRYPIGCFHISSITNGVANTWNGGYDHHTFVQLEDFNYMVRYQRLLPDRWASLELENSFAEQIMARTYIERLLTREAETDLAGSTARLSTPCSPADQG
jgi:hypothetical protein